VKLKQAHVCGGSASQRDSPGNIVRPGEGRRKEEFSVFACKNPKLERSHFEALEEQNSRGKAEDSSRLSVVDRLRWRCGPSIPS
jgi:hypothetical protein